MKLEIVQLPVTWSEIAAIEGLLRDADPFIACIEDPTCLYSIRTHVTARMTEGKRARILLDRNILTRMSGLASAPASTPQHRLVSGIAAFSILTEAAIEPNIALYELASTQGNSVALEELAAFRQVDNADPRQLAAIALGTADQLEVGEGVEVAIPKIDLTAPPRQVQVNYIAALKLGLLALEGGPPEPLFRRFIQWLHDDFLHSIPAILLASRYLAPNSSRRGLLKKLFAAGDRTRAVSGVRNAAWDLCLLSYWFKQARIADANTVWILATLDRATRDLAQDMLLPSYGDAGDSDLEMLKRTFARWWGEAAQRLAAHVHENQADSDNPSRACNQANFTSNAMADLRRALEEQLLNTR